MIKLITIDLDGTLFNKNKEVTNYNREMIKKAREKGVYVVIATGRPIDGIRSLLNDLNMTTTNDYVISYNGAMVFNIANKQSVCSSTISGKDVKILYQEAKRLNLNFHAFKKNGALITPKYNEYTNVEATINKIPAFEVNFDNIKDNELFIKAMIVDSKENIDIAFEAVRNELKDNYSMVRSANIFLEFLAKGTDKGYALMSLAKHLNIDMSETMAIGDANNDKHMIQVAGIGVAMANSFPEILKIADYITLSNEESGVGHAIEKFVL